MIKNLVDGPTLFGNTLITGLSDGATYALIALGYTLGAADDAVRTALAGGTGDDTAQLVRRALQLLAASRAGR